MLKGLLKSKRKKELMKEKEILELKILKIKEEIRKKDGFLKCKNNIFIEKDNIKKKEKNWDKMENNLKKYYQENNKLKGYIEKSEKIIPTSHLKYNYLISLEKYLYEARFKELVKILNNEDKKYIQDLNEFAIEGLSIEDSLKIELKKMVKKFQRLDINWKLKTYLIKGEKISKVYFKHRKFLNIMFSDNKEFMCDLFGYNFDNLINRGYTVDESKDLKKIYENYISMYRVKNLEEI